MGRKMSGKSGEPCETVLHKNPKGNQEGQKCCQLIMQEKDTGMGFLCFASIAWVRCVLKDMFAMHPRKATFTSVGMGKLSQKLRPKKQ